MSEQSPSAASWYEDLITFPEGRETSDADWQQALETVRLALGGVEQAISEGRIANVELSFELPQADGTNAEFNFSAPQE